MMLPALRRTSRLSPLADPFVDDGLFALGDRLDRMVSNLMGGRLGFGLPQAWAFPADVVESADGVRVTIEAPGFDPDDLNVTVDSGMLYVSGERRAEQEVERPRYRMTERQFGRFQRSFLLPEGADPDAVQAKYEHGVLTIDVPRKEHARPRRVKITAGSTLGRLLSGKNKRKKDQEED